MPASIFIEGYLQPGIILFYVNKDPTSVAYYSRYITEISDLDNNNLKHIKTVYAVGDYGDNTLTLSWTKFPTYENWQALAAKIAEITEYGDLPVWRNLGQSRRTAFQVDWTGPSQISHEALEIAYNIKTQ